MSVKGLVGCSIWKNALYVFSIIPNSIKKPYIKIIKIAFEINCRQFWEMTITKVVASCLAHILLNSSR